MADITRYLRPFSAHMQAVAAATTADSYLYHLRPLLGLLARRLRRPVQATDLVRRRLQPFFEGLKVDVHLSAGTICYKAAVIARFVRFLREEREIQIPELRLRLPKRPRRLPRFMTHAEMRLILEAVERIVHRKVLTRDQALVELLYGAGLRISEALGLDLGDVYFDMPRRKRKRCVSLHIRHGKGNKERWVVCGPMVLKYLKQYLPDRTVLLRGAECPALFVSERQRRLSRDRAWHMVHSVGLSVDVRASPHRLRHTYATHSRWAGAPLDGLQAQMGHDDPKTTQLYAAVDLEMLYKTACYHPRFDEPEPPRARITAPMVPQLLGAADAANPPLLAPARRRRRVGAI